MDSWIILHEVIARNTNVPGIAANTHEIKKYLFSPNGLGAQPA